MVDIETFYHELISENTKLDNGETVSDIGVRAPRIKSSIDKKTNIAHDLAFKLFPIPGDKSIDVEKVHSYIRYSQFVGKLTRAYKEQQRIQKEIDVQAYKDAHRWRQARIYGGKQYFLDLLDEPIQYPVLYPEPMPVDIAPLDDLQPFFNHMKKNEKCDEEQLEFTRGAYYDDGRIDMCKQVVGPTWIPNLIDSIKDNPHVKHFLMGNNIANTRSAEEISTFIRDVRPEIETWYLAGNCIDADGVKMLCDSLIDDTSCKALWLKRNPLMLSLIHI